VNLDNHLNIIFDEIRVNSNQRLIDIWKNINILTKSGLDLNSSIAFKRLIRSFFLFKYFKSVNHLSGNILEVGVFRGFSALFLKQLEDILNLNSKKDCLFLIDSFEGLSKINEEDNVDNDENYQHQEGHFKVNFENIQNLFKDYDNVKILKGWIPNVFDLLNNKNLYKFVHIDVDLFEPTLDTLNYIFDKVVKGGVIITDDFESKAFPGNRKAWQKFFIEKNILNSIALPSGQAVYIKE
tara:strand:+ start:199 stop:915 length:717 start_codon:yes stop_codon:yes gene_type:complete